MLQRACKAVLPAIFGLLVDIELLSRLLRKSRLLCLHFASLVHDLSNLSHRAPSASFALVILKASRRFERAMMATLRSEAHREIARNWQNIGKLQLAPAVTSSSPAKGGLREAEWKLPWWGRALA